MVDGFLTRLLRTESRELWDLREVNEVLVWTCSGCETHYGESEGYGRDDARRCCASKWRGLEKKSRSEVRRSGYRKLATQGLKAICSLCNKEVDHWSSALSECQCERERGELVMGECPICSGAFSAEEAEDGGWMECCLWKVLGHAEREEIKAKVQRGGDPAEEVRARLLRGSLTAA